MTRESKIKELVEFGFSQIWLSQVTDDRIDNLYHEFFEKDSAVEEELHECEDGYGPVDRPQHYASTSIECIDAMRETQGDIYVYHFCICNAFKYLWRHNQKNQFEDIKKANWYLTKAIEIYERYKDEN